MIPLALPPRVIGVYQESVIRPFIRAFEPQWLRAELRKIGKLLVSNLGRRSDAVPHLRRLTEIEPENASNWRVYGDVPFDLDDPAAKSIFARYLEVADPNDPEEQEWFPKIRAYVERGEVPVPESP